METTVKYKYSTLSRNTIDDFNKMKKVFDYYNYDKFKMDFAHFKTMCKKTYIEHLHIYVNKYKEMHNKWKINGK